MLQVAVDQYKNLEKTRQEGELKLKSARSLGSAELQTRIAELQGMLAEKEEEYSQRFKEQHLRAESLQKEVQMLYGELDRKQELLNTARGDAIKHKQNMQKAVKEKKHLTAELREKDEQAIKANNQLHELAYVHMLMR